MFVSVKQVKLENEPFPAITLCYDNTVKWPGILKAATKLTETNFEYHYTNGLHVIFEKYFPRKLQLAEKRGETYAFEATENDDSYNFCNIFDEVFSDPDEAETKEFYSWIFDYFTKLDNETITQ